MMVVYLIKHKNGYCLTFDKKKKAEGYVKALCGWPVQHFSELSLYNSVALDGELEKCPGCWQELTNQEILMNNCENCAFMTVLYPNLQNPNGDVLCTLGLWSGDAPPDGDEFADCPDFRSRAPCQRARDCEKGVPWATDESDKDEPVIIF